MNKIKKIDIAKILMGLGVWLRGRGLATASIWYDEPRQCFRAVFHAHTYIGLIVSADGVNWRRSKHYQVTGKAIRGESGVDMAPERLERPSVYLEDGTPRVLCLGAATGDDWCCLLVPLSLPQHGSAGPW